MKCTVLRVSRLHGSAQTSYWLGICLFDACMRVCARAHVCMYVRRRYCKGVLVVVYLVIHNDVRRYFQFALCLSSRYITLALLFVFLPALSLYIMLFSPILQAPTKSEDVHIQHSLKCLSLPRLLRVRLIRKKRQRKTLPGPVGRLERSYSAPSPDAYKYTRSTQWRIRLSSSLVV